MKKACLATGTMVFLVVMSMSFVSAQRTAVKLTPLEELGKRLFFDKNLSNPAGQECAA